MNIKSLFFSPTGTTERVVSTVSSNLNQLLNQSELFEAYDFTLPFFRNTMPSFTEDDVVIVGVPVYAGRVPNILLKSLTAVSGNGAKAVGIVLYGNRNYDDALIELREVLTAQGFKVIAGAAFIGEHSFSKRLAKGRPTADDLDIAKQFAHAIFDKLNLEDCSYPVRVKGTLPLRPYYRPINPKGEPVDIRKVTPKTSEACIDCKLCATFCPMGSIDYNHPSQLTGICIKCGACEKKCPIGAKYYDDENYLRHKFELEDEFKAYKAPELFV